MAQTRVRFLDDHDQVTREDVFETDGNHMINDWLKLDGVLWIVIHAETDEAGNETVEVLLV